MSVARAGDDPIARAVEVAFVAAWDRVSRWRGKRARYIAAIGAQISRVARALGSRR